MKGSERLSGPAWSCFRAEFHHRWRRRSVARLLGWLFLIVGVQFTLSLGAQRLGMAFGTVWFSWLMGILGLYSPLAQIFDGRSSSSRTQTYLLVYGILSIPWLAGRFLLPAAAATSIAPDREQRRLSELLLTGLTPRQVLWAKGLAAVLPILAAALAALVACAAYQLSHFDGATSPFLTVTVLTRSVVAAVNLLLSTAIQVCISALSRRTRSALTLCYGFECFLIPLLSQVSPFVWMRLGGIGAWPTGWDGFGWFLVPQLSVPLFGIVALGLLWPRALRALAYPDEVAGSQPTPVRDAS